MDFREIRTHAREISNVKDSEVADGAVKLVINNVIKDIQRKVLPLKKTYQFRTKVAATITGITQADPGVVTTSAAHGFSVGDRVAFTGVVGMTELNGIQQEVTAVGSTTITITDDTTNFTAYDSAGSVYVSEYKFSLTDFFKANYVIVDKINRNFIRRERIYNYNSDPYTDTGEPEYAYIGESRDTLGFIPNATSEYPVEFVYYITPTALAADADLSPFGPMYDELIIYGVVYRLLEFVGNEAADKYRGIYFQLLNRFSGDMESVRAQTVVQTEMQDYIG